MHPVAKARLTAASGNTTQRSSVPDVARRLDWPVPWTIRTLENAFTARWRNDLDGLRTDAGEIERCAQARDAADFDTASATHISISMAIDIGLNNTVETVGTHTPALTGRAPGRDWP